MLSTEERECLSSLQRRHAHYVCIKKSAPLHYREESDSVSLFFIEEAGFLPLLYTEERVSRFSEGDSFSLRK